MVDQPRYEPLEPSTFFPDGMSARPPVSGTVARGQLHEDEAFYKGKVDGQYVNELPVEIDRELIERGGERFNIYCAVCHGPSGYGDGMIVQRGFRKPPSYHIERLHDAPPGHFFDVMTNGFGAMGRYSTQIEPRDRWAIVAYIRALQVSQNATLDNVPPEQRASLKEAAP
jgi:mono/diheme cytochrome c family protein